MQLNSSVEWAILLTSALLLSCTSVVSTQCEPIELWFLEPTTSVSDTSRTMESLVKVQGTGIFTQDGLYLLTHYGDRRNIFNSENRELMENPLMNQTWRHCSVFSAAAGNSVVLGRNWDNQTVGSIIINLYRPTDGYSSISFSRSIDIGFGHKDLQQYASSVFGPKLLLAPFYATDGINDHGLAVACAGVEPTAVGPRNGKTPVYTTFLIRKILDQARNVEEASELVEDYVPFDIDQNTLSSHLLVSDSSGRSVILEYGEDRWAKTYSNEPWQILSTRPIYGIPITDLRANCRRYDGMYRALENAQGNVDWERGLSILRDIAQRGTTWSVVYSLPAGELFFSVYQDWDKVYHLTMP